MLIKTSANLSATLPESAARLNAYVADKSHSISVSADIAGPTASAAGTEVAPGAGLTPLPQAQALTPRQNKKVEKALMKFAASQFGHLKAYVPGSAPYIDGAELLFASRTAFNAITDPQRTSMTEPLLKTGRAMAELIDVVKPYLPALNNNPYVDVASVLIKVGDSVYTLHADLTKPDPKPGPAD